MATGHKHDVAGMGPAARKPPAPRPTQPKGKRPKKPKPNTGKGSLATGAKGVLSGARAGSKQSGGEGGSRAGGAAKGAAQGAAGAASSKAKQAVAAKGVELGARALGSAAGPAGTAAGTAAGKLAATAIKNPKTTRKVIVAVAAALLVVPILTIGGIATVVGQAVAIIAADEQARAAPVIPGDNECTPVPGGPAEGDASHLDSEQVGNAGVIIDVGAGRDMPEFGQVIAVATAMQESSLRNIDWGDRDSVGLFQQRPSMGWGSVEQIMDPQYSSNAFYDALEAVDGWQDMSLTVAAQTVQRSAFPDEYAKHEDLAWALLTSHTGGSSGAGCAGVVTQCEPLGEGEVHVESGLTPDALNLARCGRATWGDDIGAIHGVGERSNNSASDHPAGRAIDFMIPRWDTSTGRAVGDEIAEWVIENTDVFGVNYIIWYDEIWIASNPGWKPYTHPSGNTTDPTLRHLDHLHISVFGSAGTGVVGEIGEDGWTRPLGGTYSLTSSYGFRTIPFPGMHAGQDLAQACESPMYAVADGTVIGVGLLGQGRTGNQMLIDHGDGITSRYGHLWSGSFNHISAGDTVAAGQQIGEVGGDRDRDPVGAGNSTGCHLHFEIAQDGITTDPVPFMQERGAAL